VIRAVAGHDPERAQAIYARWPLREVLLAFLELRRRESLEQHRFDVLTWQIGGKGEAPRPQAILREET